MGPTQPWLVWGAGKGPSRTHTRSFIAVHTPHGRRVCVCVCLCVNTHTHTSPLTDPAQGRQSPQQGHLTLGNPHHGSFFNCSRINGFCKILNRGKQLPEHLGEFGGEGREGDLGRGCAGLLGDSRTTPPPCHFPSGIHTACRPNLWLSRPFTQHPLSSYSVPHGSGLGPCEAENDAGYPVWQRGEQGPRSDHGGLVAEP